MHDRSPARALTWAPPVPRVSLLWAVVTLSLALSGCGSRIEPGSIPQYGVISEGGTVSGLGNGLGELGPVAGPASNPGLNAVGPGGAALVSGSPTQGPDGGGADTQGGQAGPSGAHDGPSPHGSCQGFADQTGITDDTITIANASDISGPVPGIFEASQDAVRAFAAYFNATDDLCGRKLQVLDIDTRTDAGGDQQAYERACAESFAAVGSMAAFDSGGAATAQGCGLPDLRSTIVTGARTACTTCFGTQSGNPVQFPNSVPDYLVARYPQAVKHTAYLWIDAGPAVENASAEIAAWRRRGLDFVYQAGIDVADFNYSPYVQQLKSSGARIVRMLSSYDQAVKLAQAMQQQDYHPDLFLLDATGYDDQFVDVGGAAVDGAEIFVNFRPFEEAGDNRELQTYLTWLQQVKPGAVPTFSGLFSWSAARLFMERAQALGGRLTRSTMVDALRRVDHWTDHGLHAPQHVGSKAVGGCWRFLRLEDGRWAPQAGSRYRCSGITSVD